MSEATKSCWAFSVAFAGLLLAIRADDTAAQDRGPKGKTEQQTVVFLTDADSVLARRLREKGKVELAVVRPYKHVSIACRLSEFKKIEGTTPDATDYFIEQVLLSRKPKTQAKTAGYFLKAMDRGATLRNITNKGVCDAVLRASWEVNGKSLRFVVCEAMLSAYSGVSDRELPND